MIAQPIAASSIPQSTRCARPHMEQRDEAPLREQGRCCTGHQHDTCHLNGGGRIAAQAEPVEHKKAYDAQYEGMCIAAQYARNQPRFDTAGHPI